jgi:hypothetical protein
LYSIQHTYKVIIHYFSSLLQVCVRVVYNAGLQDLIRKGVVEEGVCVETVVQMPVATF